MTDVGYDEHFYAGDIAVARRAAAEIVPLVMERVKPQSVVDLGCALGVWLAEFARHGITDYLGVDGEWVDTRLLEIPVDRFRAAHLDKPFRLDRRFDLAVSTEVAEHLPEHAAKGFVETIVRLAPCVLFSAAIPHQGGTQHLNEQWPEYWAELFARHQYQVVDGIRPIIWSNPNVAFFHAQNLLIFARPEFIESRPLLARDRVCSADSQLSLVHPRLLARVAAAGTEHARRPTAREFSLRELADALPHAAGRSLRWRWRRFRRAGGS